MRSARIAGVRTNANMLAAAMTEADFTAGQTFTAYLAEHPHVVADRGPIDDDRLALVIAATLTDEAANRSADAVTGFTPSGWRNLRTRGQRRSWIDDTSSGSFDLHQVEYQVHNDLVAVLIGPWPEPAADGTLPEDVRRSAKVRVLERADECTVIELDGRRHVVTVRSHAHDMVLASSPAGSIALARPARWVDHDETAAGGGPVCPLPGTVIAVHVEAGAMVDEGQLLMVVEAMKMEHKIVAAVPSVVTEVRFAVGDRVDQGDLLVALTATPPSPIGLDSDGSGSPESDQNGVGG
jgi:propionyl-CoA carboxylase alpha chain